MLAAEKIVKFLRGQGPGQEAEGSQSSETAPAGWLARRLLDAAWVTYVGESATDGGGRAAEPWMDTLLLTILLGVGAKQIPSAARPMWAIRCTALARIRRWHKPQCPFRRQICVSLQCLVFRQGTRAPVCQSVGD